MRTKYKDLRVAIVDTDCHHGDGTEDIYYNDANTLFISLHQDGRTLYPGTGDIGEMGGPGGYGYNVNIPLPPGTGDQGFLYALENVVLPILEDFKPDLIINSAGQDNHYSDPLTNMNFSAQGYAILNERLNPDIAVLEGGYSIEGAILRELGNYPGYGRNGLLANHGTGLLAGESLPIQGSHPIRRTNFRNRHGKLAQQGSLGGGEIPTYGRL